MNRVAALAFTVAGVCAVALTAVPTASATPSTALSLELGGSVAAGSMAGVALPQKAGLARAATGMDAPWARQRIEYGARDGGAYAINHVRELQYRLKWVGLFEPTPTGYFGTITRNGVKAFQTRRHLPATGVANADTWRLLLHRTVRNLTGTPAVCKGAGWHACYDRSMHQVTLWSNGEMWNSWLVRGGSSTTQTRLGTHQVYYRDIDHVSGMFGSAMPYSQFFDGGEALHGSPLMTNPFVGHSHGCVNMYIKDARQLWGLTYNKTLWVTVYGAWS